MSSNGQTSADGNVKSKFVQKKTKYTNTQNSERFVRVSVLGICSLHYSRVWYPSLCRWHDSIVRCCTNSTQTLLFSLSIDLHLIDYHYFFMNKSSFYYLHQKVSCLLMILYISSCSHLSIIIWIKQAQLVYITSVIIRKNWFYRGAGGVAWRNCFIAFVRLTFYATMP